VEAKNIKEPENCALFAIEIKLQEEETPIAQTIDPLNRISENYRMPIPSSS